MAIWTANNIFDLIEIPTEGYDSPDNDICTAAFKYSKLRQIYTMSTLINGPKKVIFNGPATVVLWKDGTKTVVKCKEGDPYSKEAGFALCLLKKLSGNDFHKVLRKACDDKEKK